MFWVYAIKAIEGERVYVGQTSNLRKRVAEHNRGLVPSTKRGRPWKLIALDECESRETARWLERRLKRSRGLRLKWLEGRQDETIDRRDAAL
jgi:putative endonuclease